MRPRRFAVGNQTDRATSEFYTSRFKELRFSAVGICFAIAYPPSSV